MKNLLPAFLLLLAVVSLAGITSTPAPVAYQVYLDSGAAETGKRPTTHEECITRAMELLPRGTCVTREGFDNALNCDGVEMPTDLVPVADVNGVIVLPELVVLDDWSTNMDRGYVPTGIAPGCWAPGLVPHFEYIAPEGPGAP